MEAVVHGFEIVGVAILVAGAIAALARYVLALARGQREGAFARVRHGVGRAILLGLEVLIIADIVQTKPEPISGPAPLRWPDRVVPITPEASWGAFGSRQNPKRSKPVTSVRRCLPS